jgi:hypothetical protein
MVEGLKNSASSFSIQSKMVGLKGKKGLACVSKNLKLH